MLPLPVETLPADRGRTATALTHEGVTILVVPESLVEDYPAPPQNEWADSKGHHMIGK